MNCEICGGLISSKRNKSGICGRNEACRKESQLRLQRVHRKAVAAANPKAMCEICGNKLRKNNTKGICTANPSCRNEGKKRRIRDAETAKFCELCGSFMDSRTKVGICTTNPECKAENKRRHRSAFTHDELTYLMYSPGLNTHKIGFTTALESRLINLRCGCWDIELVITFPYGRSLEKWLHAYFASKRINPTEWFTNLTETDVKNAVAEYELSLPS